MATGIQISPPSGITIGTTAIDSGVDTRVLFQQGGVVQQDANFTFNNTQKRLTLRASGTTVSDVPIRIRNSADTADLFAVTGNKAFNLADALTSDGFTTRLYSTTGILQLTASGNGLQLTSNFSASLNATNDVSLQTNATTRVYLNNTGLVGIGNTSPAARLDVRAQGTLSTDIAFRVRNSADTVNSVEYNGDGSKYWRAHSGDMHLQFDPVNSRIHLKRTGNYLIQTDNAVTELQMICNAGNLQLRGGSKQLHIYSGGNFHLGGTALLAGSGDGNLIFQNGTAPSTNLIDRHYYYSADIVAGNAAPHFRTENGSIIKLYKETAANVGTGATFTNGSGTAITEDATFGGLTLAQIAKALGNLGLVELTA